VWFAVSIGVLLVWGYTGIYSLVSPGWFWTPAYGNSYFLFRSVLFWFCIPLAFALALLPRFMIKSIRSYYWPSDLDLLKEIKRSHPEYDFAHHPLLGGRGKVDNVSMSDSRVSSRVPSRAHDYPPHAPLVRPSMEGAARSVTDMSLGGVQSTHRGFDFASEEGGVHIRRMQSNLSERRLQALGINNPDGSREGGSRRRRPSISLFPSLRRSVRRRMRPNPKSPPLPPSPPTS